MNELLRINTEKASITMSSREIAELLQKDLTALLKETKWFESLDGEKLSIESASILSFCMNKEIQKSATSIYNRTLELASETKFLECRNLLDGIENLKNIAWLAEFLFKEYPDLSSSFRVLRELLFDIHFGLISLTSPTNIRKNERSNEKTYIIYNPKTKQIKIGKSISPKQRIKTLETQSGVELDVLTIIDSNRESELHKKFSKYRTVGEWFYDKDGEIRKFAETLNQGVNDENSKVLL